METLGKSKFEVTYNNKDISKDISEYLISIKYQDKTGQEADELTITLENVDAVWENDWYPEKGAKLSAKIGTEELTLNCGDFELDEIEIASPPDTVVIRAISAGITGSLRTSKSVAHEKTTLKQIVEKVASDNGLTVEGVIGDIQFERITQNRETDLGFLRRLAEKYGFMFSVRGDKLVFTDMVGVMAAASIATIDRNDCTSYSIKDKSAKVFRKANLPCFNPQKKDVISFSIKPIKQYTADGREYEIIAPLSKYVDKIKADQKHQAYLAKYPNAPAEYEQYYETMSLSQYYEMLNKQNMESNINDAPEPPDEGMQFESYAGGTEFNSEDTFDNESQAEVIGNAAVIKNATSQQEGTISMQGDPFMVAGINFQFTGIGKLSGKYHVDESEHSIEKESGYNTTLSIKRVGFIELTKHKRKSVAKKSTYDVSIVK